MTTSETMIKYFKPTFVGADTLPWHPFTPYSDEVLLKLLHVDFVSGHVVVLLKAPGGANLGVHNHYGTVLLYTVQGAWRYAEHDWVSTKGDFVYEVANTQHTFLVEPGEDVIVFVTLEGPLQFLDENGNGVGLENAHTFVERYEAYCAKNSIDPVDLSRFSLS